MSNSSTLALLAIAFIVIAFVLLITDTDDRAVKCQAKGGVLVASLNGYEACIDRKALR
jgi:hypothetical protein